MLWSLDYFFLVQLVLFLALGVMDGLLFCHGCFWGYESLFNILSSCLSLSSHQGHQLMKQEDGRGGHMTLFSGPVDTTQVEEECWPRVPGCRRLGWDFSSPVSPWMPPWRRGCAWQHLLPPSGDADTGHHWVPLSPAGGSGCLTHNALLLWSRGEIEVPCGPTDSDVGRTEYCLALFCYVDMKRKCSSIHPQDQLPPPSLSRKGEQGPPGGEGGQGPHTAWWPQRGRWDAGIKGGWCARSVPQGPAEALDCFPAGVWLEKGTFGFWPLSSSFVISRFPNTLKKKASKKASDTGAVEISSRLKPS